jgi:CcmD family protein
MIAPLIVWIGVFIYLLSLDSKIKGLKKLGLLVSFLMVLLKMASLLQAKDAPKAVEDKELLVKLYFYLLSSGISQLNKAGHPQVSEWAKKSPDRVYSFAVEGKPDLAAYVRVKAGNSKSGRGQYTRSSPFFTLSFDSVLSALGILLQKDDMITSTAQGKLIMKGAPEFGAQLGEFMMIIAGYAK